MYFHLRSAAPLQSSLSQTRRFQDRARNTAERPRISFLARGLDPTTSLTSCRSQSARNLQHQTSSLAFGRANSEVVRVYPQESSHSETGMHFEKLCSRARDDCSCGGPQIESGRATPHATVSTCSLAKFFKVHPGFLWMILRYITRN